MNAMRPLSLGDLIARFGHAPEPWVEGRTIPWDDLGFSERMLREHLSQAHDGASRRSELIERHVALIEGLLPSRPSRILDLGCGPGLYALRLAEHGHDVLGVDFSPASIAYAREQAASRSLRCRFELGDVRTAEYGSDCDLVMLLYGELNLFQRHEAVALLRRCADALAPGAKLLLEVHSYDAVQKRGEAPPKWSAVPSGLFSEQPHLRADESFWSEGSLVTSGRHWIVDAASSDVTLYGWSMLAYSDAEYESLLQDAGLRLQERFESLMGEPDAGDFPVLIAVPDVSR